MTAHLLRKSLKLASPRQIVATALARHQTLSIAFSGAEDVLVLDLVNQCLEDEKDKVSKPELTVFVLDTGRLHPETYTFLDVVRTRYSRLPMMCLFPDTKDVASLASKQGWHSFRQNGHSECCRIRKVDPLLKHLRTCDGWMTGQRRDQSETREDLQIVEEDTENRLKWNPLAHWNQKMVWDYILKNNIPYNELHQKGYQSIGCAPCTIATLPSQHERMGRWPWEQHSKKE